LFGLFVALAVLAKGPAAIALVGGAVGLWAASTAHWRVALRLAHPTTIAVFLVVALPWHVICAVRNPAFLRVFIFQHNVERYFTPMFQHRQPFWFFGPIVLLALLPWTVFLWPAALEGIRLWREKSWRDSPGFFSACWAAFPVFFFSFSQSKLPGYVLPSIPPLALLSSVAAIRAMEERRFKTRLIFAGVGFAWVLFAMAAWRGTARVPIATIGNFRTIGTIASLVVALVLLLVSASRQPQLAIALSALSLAVALEVVSLTALPALEPVLSARSHRAFMANDKHPDRIFTYDLQRSWTYGLAFYFHRELPEWAPTDPEAALVLTTPDGLAEIEKLGRFEGALDEPYVGILYVPVRREPR
jgi:4-amino-4-deoxy-L-arabinose transferase-like glycosyltransferase